MAKEKKVVRKWLSWILVGSWMGFIFYLSHQPAGESSALSTGVVQTVLSFIDMVFSIQLTQSELLHVIIRKGAHVLAYFILALLVLMACRTSGWMKRTSFGITLIICIIYAVSDEVHQLFIDGRSGQVTDVLIDTTGTCLGIAMYIVSEKIYRRVVHRK